MLYLIYGVMLYSLFICTFAAAKVVLRWPKAINMLKKSGLAFNCEEANPTFLSALVCEVK